MFGERRWRDTTETEAERSVREMGIEQQRGKKLLTEHDEGRKEGIG